MLDDEVIEAVKARKFTIWAVSHIDEGIEILTGLQAGTRDKRGHFPPDTLHYLVDQKLTEWHERRKSFASDYRRTMPQGRKRRGRF
jgi:predicted ATP-dependent protease